jgi:hypothetical protein
VSFFYIEKIILYYSKTYKMGGGLLQLVAYGAQDVYLTGNPQITFFKVVYRRHTNFSMESIVQTFNGDAKLGNRVTAQISRNGDLLHKLYLKISFTLPKRTTAGDDKKTYLQPFYGYRMLKTVELEIGGQRIDRQYGEWMYLWNELTMPDGKKDGFYNMVGGQKSNAPIEYNTSYTGGDNINKTLYIPLEFWFCRNIGLALPLIALQYHEVKLNVEFNPEDMLWAENTNDKVVTDLKAVIDPDNPPATTVSGTPATTISNFKCDLWADYVFLDTDERRRFAQMSHEYLIEQVQFTGTEAVDKGNKSYRLSFNHPVKELVWAIQPKKDNTKYNWNNFGYKATSDANSADNGNNNMWDRSNCVAASKLMLNGNDRFAQREGEYFSLIQPYQHHTNIPTANPGINVYSFALKPEEHQCSGTLNFSRIDQAALQVDSKVDGTMFVFAHNYNVLRILSGMGGLAYSN